MRKVAIINIIYRLKREFGVALKLQWRETIANNRETGDKTVSYNSIELRQAILLPEDLKRDFKYDLSFIAGNKNFTYGAYFDVGERGLILDIKDLKGFIPKQDHFVVYRGRRYEVKDIKEITDISCFMLTVKELVGATKNELFKPKDIKNNIALTDSVSVLINGVPHV